jgi:hypothetical protein
MTKRGFIERVVQHEIETTSAFLRISSSQEYHMCEKLEELELGVQYELIHYILPFSLEYRTYTSLFFPHQMATQFVACSWG